MTLVFFLLYWATLMTWTVWPAISRAWPWKWHRRLRRTTGEVYMDRWQLLRTKLLSIYINRINMPDEDPLPHTHPWRKSWSVRLKGWYIEEVYSRFMGCHFVQNRVCQRFNRIPNAHRIVALRAGGCWTLFIGWRADRPWGFVKPDGTVIPHQTRKAERGVTEE